MINNKHKDRLFTFLFGREEHKDWTLSLYNAVNRTNYTEPDEIEIVTIENAVYMGMKNDLAFILHCHISLYEHQSTFNPNMPLRGLMYAGMLYDKYIHRHRLNIYGSKVIRVPIPKLMTFYNGTDETEDRILLRLSDAFPDGADIRESDIEVTVTMLNINHGRNRELMKACRPLAEYAWFIEEIRKNQAGKMDIETAVDKAIDDMPDAYVIKTILIANRAEVKQMCITEYDEAETMRMFREEAREEGRLEGRLEGEAMGIIDAGFDFGLSEQDILNRLQSKLRISSQEAQEYFDMFEKQRQL